MLESIISPRTAERNSWDMFLLGFIVVSLALVFSVILAHFMPISHSLLVLLMIVIALVPLIHRVLVMEETKDESAGRKDFNVGLFGRHLDTIALYAFLFIGLLAGYTFWYIVLPHDISGVMFDEQVNVYKSIGGTGSAHSPECFNYLYENNLRVMFFCFLSSFMFGAGAIWILSWNASVIAVFIGERIRQELANLPALHAYFVGFPTYSLQLALWGIPEIGAYFIAGLAGGIISVAVARHHFKSRGFWFVIGDGLLLLVIATALVISGAYLEHFFVPAGRC